MTYPSNIEQILDFDVIRTKLVDACSFKISKEEVEQLHFLTDFSAIVHDVSQTEQMRLVLQDGSIQKPDVELCDLRQSLSRCRIEGLYMDEQELFSLRKAIEAAARYQHFFSQLDKQRFPLLCEEKINVESVESEQYDNDALTNIIKNIDRLIDKYGRMRDNASVELARIRHDLQQAQNNATKALISILRQAQVDGLIDKDVAPTLREGRLVLPIPPAYKRKIGGIVHDESATGKTVFIEPQQVVEANNKIRELENEERRERVRILIDFANYLRPYMPLVLASQNWLGHIDFLRAKAIVAIDLKAIAPQMADEPIIDLRMAKHPVLWLRLQKEGREVVPLTMGLGKEKNEKRNHVLVISGPNAGGKSVCLKTVALLQYMLQCGLLVPVREDSTMGCFEKLLIDIGDQQSLIGDLSTYSSHLRNMKQFLKESQKRTLFLIDEFGSGTEPAIGGAIAQAVLEQLVKSEAVGVITTHYDNLKHFAEQREGIVSGAMLYDRGALKPMFELSIGQPGSSFAIEIASQIGLPRGVIDYAKELVGDDKINYDRQLQDIARDKRYWEKKRESVKQKEKQLEAKISQYEEHLSGVKAQKRQILQEAHAQAEELLQRSNAVIEKTIKDIKEANADKEKTQKARQKIEQLKDEVKSKKKKDKLINNSRKSRQTNSENPQPLVSGVIMVGQRIRKKGTDMIGEVIALTDKQALISFGSIQSYMALKDIEPISNNQAKRVQTVRITTQTNVSDSLRQKKLHFNQELDMRGMRVDEALIALQGFLDDAIMVGVQEVRILHGTGTGALRQVVRSYLQMQHRISSFYDAHPDQGGAGITIVEL